MFHLGLIQLHSNMHTGEPHAEISQLMDTPYQPAHTELDIFISDSSDTDTSHNRQKKDLSVSFYEWPDVLQDDSSADSDSSAETEITTASDSTSATAQFGTLLSQYIKDAVTVSLQYEASSIVDDIKIKKGQEIIYNLTADTVELKEQISALDMDLSLATFQIFISQAAVEHLEKSVQHLEMQISHLTDELNSSINARANQQDTIAALTLELRKNRWGRYSNNYE